MTATPLIAPLDELRAADEALTSAVEANREQWGWAFNEMSDDQAEALNRFFNAVTRFLADTAEPKPAPARVE